MRFDALAKARGFDRSLSRWTWHHCAQAQYQLRAVVLKLRVNDYQCAELDPAVAAELESIANDGDAAIRQLNVCQQLISAFAGP